MQILPPGAGPGRLAAAVNFLELPTVRQMVSLVSVEEYHRMPEYNARGVRTELIRGIVIEKVGKTPLQCYLLSRLRRMVTDAVGEQLLVSQWEPITMQDSEPEPDLSVVDGQMEDFRDTHPTTALLAVEVADTTVELDRAKAELYAEAGISEFWLVLAQSEKIERHVQPVGDRYMDCRTYLRHEKLISSAAPELCIDLAALFAR